jgi:hypothetical protein
MTRCALEILFEVLRDIAMGRRDARGAYALQVEVLRSTADWITEAGDTTGQLIEWKDKETENARPGCPVLDSGSMLMPFALVGEVRTTCASGGG